MANFAIVQRRDLPGEFHAALVFGSAPHQRFIVGSYDTRAEAEERINACSQEFSRGGMALLRPYLADHDDWVDWCILEPAP